MLSLPHYREGGGSGSAGDDRDEEDFNDDVVKSRRLRLDRKKRGNKTSNGLLNIQESFLGVVIAIGGGMVKTQRG